MIQLGPLSLDPAEFASQGSAVLGIRDSGKTYTATLIAERMFDAGIPFIAFDPIGVWRFLRVPGKGKGYPVVVAGGEEADLPLSPTTAPSIVEAAMQNGVSLVIDLFDIKLSKADWRRIVRDCVTLLLHKNKQYGLRHIFLEEAAEFAPQQVRDGEVYAAVEKLARMGGNSRLGYTLINQRSQEVNKAVLELCDNLFLHRQRGLNALSNLKKWLDVAGASASDVMSTLPTLPQGECWAWLAGSDVPVHLKVPAKNSLHPDRRMTRDEAAQTEAKRAVSVDSFVAKLRGQLEKVDAEMKANDPAALKAEVARLKRELTKGEKAKAAPPPTPALIVANADEIAKARAEGEAIGYQNGLAAAANAILALTKGKPAAKLAKAHTPAPASAFPDVRVEPPVAIAAPTSGLTGPQQRVLDAIAWWYALGIERPTNEQVSFIAGYSPSTSAYKSPKAAARTAGLIDYPAPGIVVLTDAGRSLANEPDAAPSREELHRRILGRLSGPQRRVFEPVLLAWPEQMTNDDLAAAAGYAPSTSAFKSPKSSLRTLSLVSYPSSGMVRANDWLFP